MRHSCDITLVEFVRLSFSSAMDNSSYNNYIAIKSIFKETAINILLTAVRCFFWSYFGQLIAVNKRLTRQFFL